MSVIAKYNVRRFIFPPSIPVLFTWCVSWIYKLGVMMMACGIGFNFAFVSQSYCYNHSIFFSVSKFHSLSNEGLNARVNQQQILKT
jgi:hypothetical protein